MRHIKWKNVLYNVIKSYSTIANAKQKEKKLLLLLLLLLKHTLCVVMLFLEFIMGLISDNVHVYVEYNAFDRF